MQMKIDYRLFRNRVCVFQISLNKLPPLFGGHYVCLNSPRHKQCQTSFCLVPKILANLFEDGIDMFPYLTTWMAFSSLMLL